MDPIRLGVIFDQRILAGGGYQQALNAALSIKELPNELVDIVYFTSLEENIKELSDYDINAHLIKITSFDKVRTIIRRCISHPSPFRITKRLEKYTPFEKLMRSARVDLIYFLSPSNWAMDLEEINYITTNWDLCHRDDPEFPEVRWNRVSEARDRCYMRIFPRATAIFVDSDLGKRNVIRRYAIDEERIHVLPFQASEATRKASRQISSVRLNIGAKYGLYTPYVFYPAQFWAHKNHVYLLDGLYALEKRYGLQIGAIFSGADQGNLAHVKKHIQLLGLEDRVRFTGFVDNEDIPEIYRQSIALVMPSYFGPTNLPPLEAFELGVPVLYSNKAGLRDQVGDAALLMDLTNPDSMAELLMSLIQDNNLRARLIAAGRDRLKHFSSIDRVEVLRSVIEEFRWKRRSWT